MVRTGRAIAEGGFRSHEIEGALSFHNYVFYVDYGTQETHRSLDYTYHNQGNYYRLGISKNFVKNRESGNTISLGLRYAHSNFEDRLVYTDDSIFGIQPIEANNPELRAQWLELVFDLRGKVVSNLYLGLTMRWQFARSIKGQNELKTFDVPGFGTTKRQNSTAFDYYIMWRIPFG